MRTRARRGDTGLLAAGLLAAGLLAAGLLAAGLLASGCLRAPIGDDPEDGSADHGSGDGPDDGSTGPGASDSPVADTSDGSDADPSTGPEGACHPSYDPCLPIVEDLDCIDVIELGLDPVAVIGDDAYGLDSDHDGWGCEP